MRYPAPGSVTLLLRPNRMHDLETDKIVSGEKSWDEVASDASKMVPKALRQVGKDYLLFPTFRPGRGKADGT